MVIWQAAATGHIFFILLTALVAYGIVPGIGAFRARARWRRFRALLMNAASCPEPDYALVRGGKPGSLGLFRFYGTLKALQGEGVVWLGNGSLSLKADLTGVPLYMLPRPSAEEGVPTEVHWSRIHTLPEGTRIFVAGELFLRESGAVFESTRETALVAIVYEEADDTLLSHAIVAGRERNEYWNRYTPGALTAGSFSLFVYFYLLLRSPLLRLPAILALTGSLLPVAPILPPATIGYSVYRSCWKRGRAHRAARDLLRLEHRPSSGEQREAVRLELCGVAVLVVSALFELAVVFAVLSALIR